ncbi:MAG: type II secretion system F family protein, partial [Chloroflexota bacterium]|nr:type II secretion system F family protein [Chloroflexota bacterium]
MNYRYVASTEDNRIVKGKMAAGSEAAAADMLSYSGYRVLSLKEVTPFFRSEKLTSHLFNVNPTEVIMFSRQLALLLESGTDVVTSLELLQAQISNRSLRKTIGEVISDVRGGTPLSEALRTHPRTFPTMYHRLVSVGEQTGNLEVVLRRAADYMERSVVTQKSIKSAMVYPIILVVVTIAVIGVLVSFVLPAFMGLYSSFGAELPGTTRALMAGTAWLQKYGLWLLGGLGIIIAIVLLYTRTPAGKYQWGKLMLTMPRLGRINILNELSRICRSLALLYGSGLPLPEAMTLIVQGTSNSAMSRALSDVQEAMIAGQGLSTPMSRNKL